MKENKTAEKKLLIEISDSELSEKCKKWINDLCKTGGRAWSLRVPVDFTRDPDILFNELIRRFEILSQESRKAFEAGRTFVDVEDSEFKKHEKFLEKLKYKNYENYVERPTS